MGLHICLYREEDGKDFPGWDYIREINDTEFPMLIEWGATKRLDRESEYFRPTDLDALRERIRAQGWANEQRYLHLADLIEKNPDAWLHFSY